MEFIIPPIGYGVKMSATYKVSFNKEFFYIGSSVDVKRRFRRWKTVLHTGRHLNINISNIQPLLSTVEFQIIETFTDIKKLRAAETFLLSQHWDNPFLLNRCPLGETNKGVKGMRPYIGYVKPQKKKSDTPATPAKRIAQFDLQGNLIKIHDSKCALLKEIKTCKHSTVNKHLRGERGSVAGFKFKLVADDETFIEHKEFEISKERYTNTRPKFYQLDLKGNILGEFYGCGVAERASGVHSGTIAYLLEKKGDRKTSKGFKFMYADEYNAINKIIT